MTVSERGTSNKVIEVNIYVFFFPANFEYFISNINEIIKQRGHELKATVVCTIFKKASSAIILGYQTWNVKVTGRFLSTSPSLTSQVISLTY